MKDLAQLQGGFAGLEIDDKAHANARRCGKLLLPQPLSLAFPPNDAANFRTVHFTDREYIKAGG